MSERDVFTSAADRLEAAAAILADCSNPRLERELRGLARDLRSEYRPDGLADIARALAPDCGPGGPS